MYMGCVMMPVDSIAVCIDSTIESRLHRAVFDVMLKFGGVILLLTWDKVKI